MDVILKWLRKVVNYHRHIRQSATKIQKIFRGYQSRCLVEEEIVKTLALYSKEVDALELLLRRGIQANVYESVSSQWIDCVLLLSGSCDAVNLSLQYRDLQTDKEQRITYLLRDIAEISRYTPVQYLSADDDRRGKWSAIPTTPINKSKSALPVRRISKGRSGFFTIVGSSLSKPSTQIAVDSKSTCIALVDSLRALVDRELTSHDLQCRGRKSWLLLSIPRLFYSPFGAYDFQSANTFFGLHSIRNPLFVNLAHFVSAHVVRRTPQCLTSPSLCAFVCSTSSTTHSLYFSFPSVQSPVHLSSPLTFANMPSPESLISFLYYSTPNIILSSPESTIKLSLHHISEVRSGTESCGFRNRKMDHIGDPLSCVSLLTPEYCLDLEFQDYQNCTKFVKSLRCLQYLERYSNKNKNETSSSLSSQPTQ